MGLSKALVVFSGGQDSTTCLAWACHDYDEVVACTIDYGQRHRIELDCAAQLAQMAGVAQHVLSIPWGITPSTLTHGGVIDASGPVPNTLVEGRNIMLLTAGAVLAKSLGITHVITGVCETDYSGYPDCRAAFIESLQTTLQLGLDYPIQLITPLMTLTKAATVDLINTLGKLEWLGHTHTCYEGQRPPCGHCPACQLRAKGFAEAGIMDPLLIQFGRGHAVGGAHDGRS